MTSKRWITFWFQDVKMWGLIDCSETWQKIKDYYGNDCRDAKKAKPPYYQRDLPYFGYRAECVGPETLGEWADKNGIVL